MESNKLLAYLSIKHNGNVLDLIQELKTGKRDYNENEVDEVLKGANSNYITLLDEGVYPERLKHCNLMPPVVLFYRGDINLLKNLNNYNAIGVVGSRECSLYGQKSTKSIIEGLPKNTVIISGFCQGIDRAAHQAALDNGLKTIAVVGGGIDYIYPKSNAELYKRILKEGGLILSEYSGALTPTPEMLRAKDRIVAGLSHFLLVGEAQQKSGTTITINFALKNGVSVGCIPYPVGSNSFCNHLIREGAFLIDNSQDLIDAADMKVNEIWKSKPF